MMIEVIDQYGERHRFDDNHCIHDADSATGVVQIGVSNDSGDYDVVATFLHPARFGEVSDDTCFTLREVPAGTARQIEQLRAENAALAAALVAKDEAIAKMCAWHELQATWDKGDNGYHKAKQILALQPHAALVAKLKAEAVREYVESLGVGNFTHQCVRCLKPYDPVGDSEDCPFCGCTDEEAKAIYDNAGCIERGEV